MFNIKLPHFEGPFDLLLFFIERDELDIHDIPIAKVTDDFLQYIKQLESLNLDVASEFILVAATLMRIKAKMLLPRREVNEAGEEIDPRQELVERLLEYKRYKSVLEELRLLEEERAKQDHRGNISSELKSLAQQALAEAELESVSLFKLLKTFERLMQEFKYREERRVHKVVQYPYSIEAQRDYLTHLVRTNGKTDFKTLFSICENRLHAIYNFLALLELLQMQIMEVTIGEGMNNFWVSPLMSE